MDNKLHKILLDLGLSENEANVYLNALSLGKTTILAISKASGVKRTTVYSAVEALKQMGLMKIEQVGWKTYFSAENPEKLERIMENKKRQLQASLGEFKALYSSEGGSSLIKYYEGMESVKNVYLDTIAEMRRDEEYLVISDSVKWLSGDRKFFENFLQKRAKRKILTRLILQDSEIARQYQKNETIYNMKIKIFPRDVQLSATLTITPHRILIHQATAPIMAMVIANKNIIRLHREIFEFMWKVA